MLKKFDEFVNESGPQPGWKPKEEVIKIVSMANALANQAFTPDEIKAIPRELADKAFSGGGHKGQKEFELSKLSSNEQGLILKWLNDMTDKYKPKPFDASPKWNGKISQSDNNLWN